MRDVSTFRLYLLRAAYLLLVVGLGSMIWPSVLRPPGDVEHMRSVVRALLAGLSLMALLGLRYPLQMLPLLLFELAWKVIWIVAIGLPLRAGGRLEGGMLQTWYDCLFGVVLMALVIPWGYVVANYVRRPGDRWRREVHPAPSVGGADFSSLPGRPPARPR